jgi:hypothetical protein
MKLVPKKAKDGAKLLRTLMPAVIPSDLRAGDCLRKLTAECAAFLVAGVRFAAVV